MHLYIEKISYISKSIYVKARDSIDFKLNLNDNLFFFILDCSNKNAQKSDVGTKNKVMKD